ADGCIRYDLRQVPHFPHVLAIELNDDIAGFDTGRLGRTLVVDARHQSTTRRLDAETLGNLVTYLLDAHTEPAAAHLLEFPQLVDNRYHRLRRHCKTNPDRTARWRNDRGIYADHLTAQVKQRSP